MSFSNGILMRLVLSLWVLGLVGGCASKGKEALGGDPWFRAARTADISAMKQMIANGRKVDEPNALGVTALMVSSRAGSPEVIKWLIEQGADASRVDQDGQSALVYALGGTSSGPKLERVVEILIKAGANPFTVDRLGFQPVQQMLDFDMDTQIRSLKFTDKKPCDLMPKRRDEVSISRAARRMEKYALAEFLEAQGCW